MTASLAVSSGGINIFDYTVDIFQELGRGGFGTVYKGFDASRNPLAVKKVAINKPNDRHKKEAIAEAVKFHFLKENVDHDHVIKVYDVKRYRDSMWIVMDFCDLGDLNSFFVEFYEKIDTNVKLNIMGQMVRGVAFLHWENIVHRDIKPGNILVKSSNGYAVVKLRDFGLSKILDPDDMTSAMSSNVGTVTFKAPEFWDRKPNDRVRYHRNVDVYAAGLTFAAMLQAKPDDTLVPKAEGSMESHETKMSIGFAAFTRCQNKHSEIRVVVPHSDFDSPLVKELKSVVEAMTYFSPEARLAAEEVAERIDSLAIKFTEGGMRFISEFNIGEMKYTSGMCYVKGNLVMRTAKTIRVYHEETGNILNEWECCHCSHLMTFEVNRKEYLLEGCIVCKVIRGYKSPETSSSYKIFKEDITTDTMCKGLKGTILVLEEHFIKQFSFSDAQFNLTGKFSFKLENIKNMCYCEKYGIVVVLHNDRKSLTGVRLTTGEVVWKRTEITFGSPAKILVCFQDVLQIPDGRICTFHFDKLFVLDPKNGTIRYELFSCKGPGCIWNVDTRNNGFQQRFAIKDGTLEQTQISVYYRMPERCLPLHNIVG